MNNQEIKKAVLEEVKPITKKIKNKELDYVFDGFCCPFCDDFYSGLSDEVDTHIWYKHKEEIADLFITKTRAECEKDGMRMFEVKDANMLREGMKIGETQERSRILKTIDEWFKKNIYCCLDDDEIEELKSKISEADKR